MKRRNFLSGLLAAPLALKARFLAFKARFFARKPVEPCGGLIFEGCLIGGSYREEQKVRERMKLFSAEHDDPLTLLAAGQPAEVVLAPWRKFVEELKSDWQPVRTQPIFCSLPRGHKGPHVLLNPR